MVQDLIGSLFLDVVAGGALSVVVAAALSQLGRSLTISGVVARLLLVSGPVYLAADDATYQSVGATLLVAISFLFGLYCLRGWWAFEHLALPVGSRVRAAVSALRFAEPPPATVTSDTLRYRTLDVVRADRQLQRRGSERSLTKAA